MEREPLLSKITPGFIKRAIYKAWAPFGSYTYGNDSMMGVSSPVWIKNNQEKLIKEGFMMNPTVYMIVSYITRLAAQIPWVLYEVKDEKILNRYKNMDPTDTIQARIYESKALEQISSNKILDIWKRPNEYQGQSEFIEQMLGFRLVTGNTYVFGSGPLTGDNVGQFHELEILPSYMVGVQYGSPQDPVKDYYWVHDPSVRIEKEKIMHSRYWSPLPLSHGGLYGLSPLMASSRLVTRNNDSITSSVKSLQNMGAIGMLSRYVGTPGEKGLTPEQAEQVEKKYYEKFGGANNRGKIMVTGAAVKWQQMAMSPVDLKIIEQEQMDLRQLCSVYGLQSQLFNDPDNKTYNNMKEAKQSAYTQAVIPVMRSIRDELNRWWIPPFEEAAGVKLWFDMDLQAVPELQTNIKELMDWLDRAKMLTYDEQRAVINYSPLEMPGTDVLWQEGGLVTPEQGLMDISSIDKFLNQTGG
jgi:HK97 family phage portal protein